jgi:putative ABC transport system permease protein
MIFSLLIIKLRQILKLRFQTLLNLSGLIVAICVFFIISHIASFELSFDTYHTNYEDIYRVQNNRTYPNLIDKSAGCPPATRATINNEVDGVLAVTRVKPLSNSVINITQNSNKSNYYHNKLFYADNAVFDVFSFEFSSGSPNSALTDLNSAVVTKSFAQKYFGNLDVLGKQFSCSNNEGADDFTISAILEDIPENSYLDFDCLLSFKTLDKQEKRNRNMDTYWGWNAFNTFVKLEPNADTEIVQSQFSGIVEKYNLSNEEMTRVFKLQPLKDIHLHSNIRHEIGRRNSAVSVYILIAISIFILVVAWINYVNISTIKSRKDLLTMNVKRFLGSKKKHFVIENIFESLLINLIAVIVSLLLLAALSPLLHSFNVELHPLNTPRWILILGITLLLSILSGLYSIIPHFNIGKVIQQQNTGGNKASGFRNTLVVFQFVLSIAFILSTGFIIKQMNFLEQKQAEMNLENIITLKSITRSMEMKTKQKAFVDKVKSIAGIEQVAVSSSVPGGDFTNFAGGIRQLGKSSQDGIKCSFFETDDAYFDLYNVRLLAGEKFAKQPSINNKTVLINTTALKMLGFNSAQEAVNKQIILGEMDDRIRTIRGVIDNFYHKALDEPINPTIIDYSQAGSYISVRYNTGLSQNILNEIKTEWAQFFPNQPLDYHFNDKFYSTQYNKYQLFGRLVSVFALLIISISCIGLYSLARFAINNRTKEIGVRKVNGAKVSEILGMLNKDFIKWVAIAFVVACPIAYYAMNKWLENFAYKTTLSWWIFALAGVLALGIALLTVSFQSYKAATRNPIESLRYE